MIEEIIFYTTVLFVSALIFHDNVMIVKDLRLSLLCFRHILQ